VQDGKLGVLAIVERGGRVHGRNLFHELRPAVVAQATTCLPLDGAGHAFIALHAPTSPDATPAACRYRAGGSQVPVCPAGTRTIDAGLLGPSATAITFRRAGQTHTAKTQGDAGGYLIVQRFVKPATVSRKLGGRTVELPVDMPLALTPASNVITRVTYDNAPACSVHPSSRPRGACPDPPGFTLVPQPAPKDVRAPIRAFAAADRRGIRLRFRAPAAVTDGRSDYNVIIRFPRRPCPVQHLPAAERAKYAGKTCSGGGYGVGLERNVEAGELVRTTIDVPNLGKDHRRALRHGKYRVEVSYRVQPPYPRISGSLASPGYKVGAASVTVP
jgi:hypothetical protein